jgi:outer membrane protein assembly factor BamA
MRGIRKRLFIGWIVALAGVPSTSAAQALPAQTRLAAVDVIGLQRLAKADVVSALGLQIGALITVADLEHAAERLSKSGVVSEVSFRYAFKGTNLTAIFTIVEAVTSTLVVFDNFPWFTDDELTASVARRLPGFSGRVADSSEAVDQVAGALSDLLKARGLAGSVTYLIFLDTRSGSRAHMFKVSGIPLPICSVDFRGVQPALEPSVRTEAAPLIGRDYSRVGSYEFLKATLTPFYRQRGHLRIQVVAATGNMAAVTASCASGVAVTATVEEGLAYSWKGTEWAGNAAIASNVLDKVLAFKDGDIADGLKLDNGLRQAERSYGRVGHLLAKLTATPRFDDASRTATFDVSVSEGPQFRMGTLTVTGVGEETARKIQEHWRLKPGNVYDEEYPAQFPGELARTAPKLLAGLGRMKFKTVRNPGLWTVDVALSFEP